MSNNPKGDPILNSQISQSQVESMLFRCFAEELNDIVWEGSNTIAVTFVNSKVYDIWGYKPEELIGKNFLDFMVPSKREEQKKVIDSMVENKAAVNGIHLYYQHRNGKTLIFETRAKPILDNNGKCVGHRGIFRDVTNYILQEKRLQKLYKQEKAAFTELENQMQQRLEFTRALAHELKTPLTVIQAANELMGTQVLSPELTNISDSIARGVQSLQKRVNELLDLAKGEVGILTVNRKLIKTLPYITNLINDLKPMVKMRNRNLLTNIPDSLPNICADEQRLTQIILNLVDNSIKYSTEKAAITISVRQDTNLDNILFQVTDTGFGIPPDKQIEIFNPYARIRKAEEHTTGLGIGLSLSRTLVELHGGQIWFETSEGIGSSFYFTMPKYTRKHMTTAFKKGQPDENCHN
ncbi:PAS domain-containing sensor histidine kinase [Dehalococcoides mccartyi]|uniref:PAS domain-containing sensor histidine kinase n=1 Tax=Dehalococcoides mccartyi TaxID=61435 RepID=UPI0003C85D48|nr:PAS domain-containing sensor histidine kinase [Dehalococcoides mccartyi]AHB13025.1 PAS/PAC sensor signal transduction histidine kinase [Dehalococcoides mccartyi GY50]